MPGVLYSDRIDIASRKPARREDLTALLQLATDAEPTNWRVTWSCWSLHEAAKGEGIAELAVALAALTEDPTH
jgi:hypothetical protein